MPDWFTIADLPMADGQQLVILAVGALVVGVGGVVAWRRLRRRPTHKLTGDIAVALATAFAAEGMWEVARESLHLRWHIAAGLFAMFEVVMVNQALMAKHKLAGPKPQTARRHMTFVWLIAAASGAIASLNSANVPEFALRLLAPSVAAGIWWTSLTADQDDEETVRSSWRWTPRRFGLWIGAIEPGDRDLVEVNRERHITQMVEARVKLLNGARLAGRWTGKLRRLAVDATADMVAEVRDRVDRVHRIVELTAPQEAELPPPDDTEVPPNSDPEVPGGSSGRKKAGTSARNNGRRGGGSSARNNGRGRGGSSGFRRTPEETRQLVAEIRMQEPAITQTALAQRVGMSDRQLRKILNNPAPVNGSALVNSTESSAS